MRDTTLTLNHRDHGVFTAKLAHVRMAEESHDHDALAEEIADAYDGVICRSCNASRPQHVVCWPLEYWQHQPTTVLRIVFCDLYVGRLSILEEAPWAEALYRSRHAPLPHDTDPRELTRESELDT